MTLLVWLQQFVVWFTAFIGVASFIVPRTIQNFVDLHPDGARGMTETRAVFGGVMMGLGGAALLFGTHEVYMMLGFMYLGTAIARLVAMVVDRSFSQNNFFSLFLEALLGIILVL
ncbi:MAG: hypothetical protein GXP37_08930 [Chloroflexi bacterium]|nr:hypothetical protein [Chloroflexota bacterium]